MGTLSPDRRLKRQELPNRMQDELLPDGERLCQNQRTYLSGQVKVLPRRLLRVSVQKATSPLYTRDRSRVVGP
jgi:hypothetical protein